MRGFAQAAVKANIQVLPEATVVRVTYRPVAIRFEIAEGPQTIVSAWQFEGRRRFGRHAAGAIGAHGGRPFYRPQLSVDREAIDRAYRNRGFQNVSVISQLAFANDQQQVAITWTMREGDQITSIAC